MSRPRRHDGSRQPQRTWDVFARHHPPTRLVIVCRIPPGVKRVAAGLAAVRRGRRKGCWTWWRPVGRARAQGPSPLQLAGKGSSVLAGSVDGGQRVAAWARWSAIITTASSHLLDDNDAGPARRIGEFGCPPTPGVIDIDQILGGPDDSSENARRAADPKLAPCQNASQTAGFAGSD